MDPEGAIDFVIFLEGVVNYNVTICALSKEEKWNDFHFKIEYFFDFEFLILNS